MQGALAGRNHFSQKPGWKTRPSLQELSKIVFGGLPAGFTAHPATE